MKKIELDVGPLDTVIADFEESLEAIELNEYYDDDLFNNFDMSILEENEEIKEELAGLSSLMDNLHDLLHRELGKVEEVHFKKAMEQALAQPQFSDTDEADDLTFSEDIAFSEIEPLEDVMMPSTPHSESDAFAESFLTRQKYRTQEKEDQQDVSRRTKRGRKK